MKLNWNLFFDEVIFGPTSMAAFCMFDCDKLNVNASFHMGFDLSLDFLMLVFFFFTRFPLTIKCIWNFIIQTISTYSTHSENQFGFKNYPYMG